MSLDLIEEGKFRYVKVGEGKPLILLHGLFGALSNFQDVINGFSNEYQVVIPMLPIYELPLLKTNVKNISRFLEDFIEHMGFDKVILLGNSLGGHVGLVYSDNNPTKWTSLYLLQVLDFMKMHLADPFQEEKTKTTYERKSP